MADPKTASGTVPEGWHAVTPRLVAHNAEELVSFVTYVFEAVGEYAVATPSILRIGDSNLMVSEAGEREPARAFLYVYVLDVDSVYRRALERGARSIELPFETPYGDRRCMVEDPWGNTWQAAVARQPDHR
ncbi:VOC family protein [Dyella sp. Tek66A03]|uniref:VOC family protein n=1 Tax=Dyella sp. Tek66A03 TaxID=3458298 RepID=UPI00403E4DEB